MEQTMRQFLPELTGANPSDQSALDRAQEIVYQALETADEAKRVALAKKALRASPDCADAYVLLTEGAPTIEEALRLYEQGVAAGQRGIGHKGFQEYAGHFWGFLETRPYMRAREGLARCLWEAGRRDEAVQHYWEMLRLNPGDNQGIRYVLASSLLTLDRDEELGKLLKQYEDDSSAEWGYTAALLAFRREGDSPRAGKLLKAAKKTNKHVPAYLTGDKPLPPYRPEYVTVGDETEAVSYAAESISAWRNTPGAVSWLRSTLKVRPAQGPKKPPPAWPPRKLALLRLPQEPEEVWQVDFLPVDTGMEDDEVLDLWRLVITNRTADRLLGSDMSVGRPSAADVWEFVQQTMLRPQEDEPHRPGRIEVRQGRLANVWQGKLKQVGIQCALVEQLEHLDQVVRDTTPPPEFLERLLNKDIDADESGLPDVPQEVGEVWQADVRRLPTWIAAEGEPQRPWTALVLSVSDDRVLATDLQIGEVPADWLWQSVHRAIRQPAIGEPHRPGVIEVASAELRAALQPHLEPAGIQCAVVEKLEPLDHVFGELSERMAGPQAAKGLLDAPGVTPAHVGSLFEAAAAYYRRAPWRQVPGDAVLQVDCQQFHTGRWYAVVMGQSGVTLGLALYEDLAALHRTLTGGDSDEENCRRMSGLSITFGEAYDTAPADLNAAEQYGWPVAGPEAFPSAIRVNPGFAFRPPLTWELQLLEGCLRTVPDFVAERQPTAVKTVPTGLGELTVKLTWLEP